MVVFYTRSEEIKNNALEEIRKLKGLWKIQISPTKRTTDQNAYFHSLIALIAPHAGYTPEDLKEILKCTFLGVREVKFGEKMYVLPIPSSSLDKKQYAILLEKTIALTHSLGIKIPARDFYGH